MLPVSKSANLASLEITLGLAVCQQQQLTLPFWVELPSAPAVVTTAAAPATTITTTSPIVMTPVQSGTFDSTAATVTSNQRCQQNQQQQPPQPPLLEQFQPGQTYAVYNFIKLDPAYNCRRSYRVAYQPSLFAPHTVLSNWGRIGANKERMLHQEFATQEEALTALTKAILKRLKRGYLLIQA